MTAFHWLELGTEKGTGLKKFSVPTVLFVRQYEKNH